MRRTTLKGKTVFLTGATGGLGRQLALQLAEAGCHLFLTSRSTEKLEGLRQELLAPDRQVFVGGGNLADADDVTRLVREAQRQLGSIDVLINCAGIFSTATLAETTDADYHDCFLLNVAAPFRLARELSADMVRRRWGRIVNIGSSSAYEGFAGTAIYCASKHALLGFSRSLHQELKRFNVRTFFMAPGSIKTPMGTMVERQIYETFLDPKEVAEQILFHISFDRELISEEVRINRMDRH